MSLRSLLAVVLIVVPLVSLLSITFYPSVQDFTRTNPFWNGLRDFSSRSQATKLDSLSRLEPQPGGSVLIAIAYVPYQEADLESMKRFVAEGGLLIAMDDYGYGNQILEALNVGIRFNGRPLLDPFQAYRNEWLPLAVDFSPELKAAGIKNVALNHATSLIISGGCQPLAWSSPDSFSDENGNSAWDEAEPKGPLPVAASGDVGRGRVIAVSDPSILINSMQGLADNEAFMAALFSQGGERPQVMIDESHITKAPLDRSKDAWDEVRQRIFEPHVQVLLVGAILALVLMPLWWKEGRKSQR